MIGIPDEKWGEAVHAIVVPKRGRAPTEAEIIAHARESIAGYKVPKSVEIRTEPLPLSGALKVLKKELRAPYWAGRSARSTERVSRAGRADAQVGRLVHVLVVVILGRGRVGAEMQPADVHRQEGRRRGPSTSHDHVSPTNSVSSGATPVRSSTASYMRRCGFRAPTHADDTVVSTVPVSPAASIASSRSQSQLEQIASVRPRSRSSASTSTVSS